MNGYAGLEFARSSGISSSFLSEIGPGYVRLLAVTGTDDDTAERSGQTSSTSEQSDAASRYPKRESKCDVSYSEIEMPDVDDFVCK